jgi:hypothetical protein
MLSMSRRLDDSWKPFLIRLVVTAGALIVALMHLMRPTAKIDGVLLGLLAVAVLPWMGSVFESVEGAGWKVTYRRLQAELDSAREELQVTKGEVASTRQRAEFIESSGVSDLEPGTPAGEMRQLVQRYDSLRETMKSGPRRTREMTDVVRHITVLADKLDDIDWPRYLISADGGERIAAYSYYYARPDGAVVPDLTYALSAEQQPFGQYWAIRALSSIAESAPSSVQAFVPAWKGFLAQLPVGTDRYYELSRLIDGAGMMSS